LRGTSKRHAERRAILGEHRRRPRCRAWRRPAAGLLWSRLWPGRACRP